MGRKALLFPVFFVLLFLVLYGLQGNAEQADVQGRSAIRWMIGRWEGGGGDLSHGWLIPFGSAFVVWLKRKKLAGLPREISWGGLGVLILALGLLVVGVRVQQTRLSILSMILLLWGTPYYLFGRKMAQALIFPAAYLLFCIPLSFLDGITVPLRLMASSISTFLLNGLGIPAMRTGTAIHSAVAGGFSVDVAEPCSGLRSLLAMLALAAPYAYFTQKGWVRQWVLFLSAVPLAIVGNIARIIAIVAAAAWTGKQRALEFSHDYSGYVVFVVAVSLMMSLGRVLSSARVNALFDRMAGKDQAGRQVDRKDSWHMDGSQFRHGLVVLGLMALTAGALPFQPDLRVIDSSDIAMSLPERVGGYVGQEILFCQSEACLRSFGSDELGGGRHCPECKSALDPVSLGEKRMLPTDTQIVRRQYRDGLGEEVLVSIVLSGREQKSIHRPQQCLPAQGHTIEGSRVESLAIPGRAPLKVMLLDTRRVSGLGSGGRLASYAYWFVGGGHETPSHFERLFWMSSDMLFLGKVDRWAYVAVQTSRDGKSDRHIQRMKAFVAELHPLISRQPLPASAGMGMDKSVLDPQPVR